MAFLLGLGSYFKNKKNKQQQPPSLFGAPKVAKHSGSVTKPFKAKPQKIHNTLIYNSYLKMVWILYMN